MPENIQLLIKPSSSACNEHCSYCFYEDEASKRNIADRGTMRFETAEVLIKKAYEYADSACDFIFQGGEPLLAGLDFYKHFVNTANELNSRIKPENHRQLFWSMQTNGSLIDAETAEFFKDNNFLVGVSLDGPEYIHNNQRGAGSFQRTLRGIRYLQQYDVEFNVLCVVTEESCKYAKDIFEFFIKEGFNVQQYIPCLKPIEFCEPAFIKVSEQNFLNRTKNQTAKLAPSAESYGRFLCKIYDLWETEIKKGKSISIRYFENIARVLIGMQPESCGMSGNCSIQFTVESDGDVYPCDFYALDEYKLGNISISSFSEMMKSEAAENFTSPYPVPDKCKACNYYMLCRGGCKREKDVQSPDCTRLCEGYKMFFDHSVERLWKLLNNNRQ